MRRFQLDITLQEEVILSARSSTVGGNHSLDYIPGASLLGVAATRLYKTLGQELAFHVFHSGKVRFGNALPLSPTDERGMPIPLAWHTDKGASIHQVGHEHWLNSGKIVNFSLQKRDESKKQVQIRSGYVTENGYLLYPKSQFRMKTAIDPTTARAATAQLFGYQSLQAGQQFRAWVDIDDGILDDTTLQELQTSLSGHIQIGRSRSAQYGGINCKVSETPVAPSSISNKSDTLVIWLQADMALRDGYGQPILNPKPEHFGIEGKLLKEKTFLRTRSYSPYNGKRRSYDQERQVLKAGSVISFELKQSLDTKILGRLQQGVGAYREHGLGQVSINHPLLMDELPIPETKVETTAVDSVGDTPDHPLARWLSHKTQKGSHKRKIRKQAEQCTGQLQDLYESARNYAGRPKGDLVGPSTTQWGRVYEAAKAQVNASQSNELLEVLFGKDNPICKGEDWSIETGHSGGQANFTDWLEYVLLQHPSKDIALLTVNLAQLARTITKGG